MPLLKRTCCCQPVQKLPSCKARSLHVPPSWAETQGHKVGHFNSIVSTSDGLFFISELPVRSAKVAACLNFSLYLTLLSTLSFHGCWPRDSSWETSCTINSISASASQKAQTSDFHTVQQTNSGKEFCFRWVVCHNFWHGLILLKGIFVFSFHQMKII